MIRNACKNNENMTFEILTSYGLIVKFGRRIISMLNISGRCPRFSGEAILYPLRQTAIDYARVLMSKASEHEQSPRRRKYTMCIISTNCYSAMISQI